MVTRSIAAGYASYSIIHIIIIHSAYVFSVAIYLWMNRHNLGALCAEGIMDMLWDMVRRTFNLCEQIERYLRGPVLDPVHLANMHHYLTPYVRSYEAIFGLLSRFIIYLERMGFADLGRIEEVEETFREAGNLLLRLYRLIERHLGIPIADSPIPLSWAED